MLKKNCLKLGISFVTMGVASTILASFNLKYDVAWLSVLCIGVGATVKGALMIDNYL